MIHVIRNTYFDLIDWLIILLLQMKYSLVELMLAICMEQLNHLELFMGSQELEKESLYF